MFTTDYTNAVYNASRKLNVPAVWIDTIFFKESSRNPQEINGIGASGLFQLTETTANDYDININEFRKMTALQQSDVFVNLVQKRAKGKIDSLGKLYIINFLPLYQNEPDNFVIPSKYVKGNSGIDTDVNGQITIREIKDFVEKDLQPYFSNSKAFPEMPTAGNGLLQIGGIFLLISLIFYFMFFYGK